MTQKNEAQLIVVLSEIRKAKTAHLALKPEIVRTVQGSEIELQLHDNALTISFKADSLARLRAILNTYLRWLTMVNKTLDIIDNNSFVGKE